MIVPLASTTYYFSSLEELMEVAMALLIEREAETLAGWPSPWPARS